MQHTWARMDQLCLISGPKMYDDHFILVYPWWLQNKAIIKTSPGPLKTQNFALFWVIRNAFGKNIDFLLYPAKCNLILATQAPTKVNLVPK